MSSSVRDTFISVAILSEVTPISKASENSFFRRSVGISEQRLALPQRSPSPLACPDLPRTGAHGRQRIGHRLLGIVVGVNADMAARDLRDDVADDGLDLVRHGAAIGIAEHHPARTGFMGRLGAGERKVGVFLVAVEEVLAIDHHLASRRLGGNDAVADRGEVFLVVVSSATRT